MKNRLNTCLAFVLAVCLSLAALSGLLWGLGTSAPLMARLMLHTAPPAATGLPEDAYAPLCRMLTGYLRGETDLFQYTLTLHTGAEVPLFHDYEQLHMADCRDLFTLDAWVLRVSLLLSALLMTALWLRRRQGSPWRGLKFGSLTMLALVAALALWGVVDFASLFVCFHRVMFRNGLWLLNPQTDWLIRLMPTRLFVTYGALVGGGWVLATAALLLCALLGQHFARKKQHHDL